MTNIIENGKLAKSIIGEGGGWGINANENTTIEYFEQNFGEYGIGWMIIKTNNIEIARHNCKFIESIEWKL